MALYDASGNQLSVEQLRQILSQYSSGDENPMRVYDANGEAISGRGGLAGREAVNNELASMGWSEGGTDFRGSNGEYYIPLDDPAKLAQAQSLGAVQDINGVSVANYNDPNLRGAYGSGALFQDMPQENMLKTIAPALIGAGLGVAGGLAGLGGVADAGVVSGGGVGGGAGGAISSGGFAGIPADALNAGFVNSAMSDMGWGAALGGATGGAAGSAVANGLDPITTGQAISGSFTPATAAEMAAAGVPVGGGALGGLGSALSSAFTNGNGSTFGIPNNVLSGLITGAGGLLAANAQGNAYENVADKYLALGAPGRAQYDAMTAPGYDITKIPGLQSAMDTAANTSARALSTRFGNPADSPTAQAEMNKYLIGNVALPQYNTSLSQALTRGGMGVNTAGTGSLAGAGTTGQGYEAIGAGIGQMVNPQPNLSDLFKQFGMGGSNPYKLNIGGLSY